MSEHLFAYECHECGFSFSVFHELPEEARSCPRCEADAL